MRFAGRALVLAVVCFAWACNWLPPPFRVVPTGAGVTLDVQTLGEYKTSISRIRVSDDRGAVVWEVRAEGLAPQIFSIKLRCGSNSVFIPEYPEYKVLVPQAPTFVLHGKATYVAEVWSPRGPFSARRNFSLQNCG